MSILIKGMEMPKDCGECHFCHTENFHQWCCLTDETISVMDTKHFMCPLEEVEPCEDAISRQAAIRWVKTECNPYGKPTLEFESGKKVIKHLAQMPSAQPEPLTDREQRIFLAAIGREEKVCKEVDEEYTREPYEDSLVRVCREIKRKVKKALWTN